MDTIMAGEATPAQIGGFLVALRLKGETADEIAGCAEAMREHVAAVQPDARRPRRHRGHGRRRREHVQHLDRGGARRRGRRRGRREARQPRRRRRRRAPPTCSRRSASSSTLPPERIEQSIDELGFGFLFAPAHHPAMKHAAPVRRELAARTVFNVLGPLTNPAGARAQVVGVYSPDLAPHDRRRARPARRAARVRRPRRRRHRRALAGRPEPRLRGRRRERARVRARPAGPRHPALRPGRAARRRRGDERREPSATCSRAPTAATGRPCC